jgi:PAS domain S-box-containing protein
LALQFNIFSVLLIVSAVATGILAFVLFRKSGKPGLYFGLTMLALSIWAFGYAFELTTSTLEGMLFWVRVEYLGIVLIPVFWFEFCLHYTGKESILNRPTRSLIYGTSIVSLLIVWTNNWHNLHYKSSGVVDDIAPFLLLSFERGPWYFFILIYFYTLLLIGTIFLIRNYRNSAPIFRKQTLIILFGTIFPWLGNLFYQLGLRPYEYIDTTPLIFSLSGLIIGFGLLRFKLLDIVPFARETVVDKLKDGILVLDYLDRIVYVNQALLDNFQDIGKEIVGASFKEVFAGFPPLVQLIQNKIIEQRETVRIVNKKGREIYFEVTSSVLEADKMVYSGQLMNFHDISNQKLAERELIEARLHAEESDKLKTAFLANMSHEIRNPMNGIIGFASILKEHDLDEEERRSYLDIIEKNAEQLLYIINDIIDISKIESGQERVKPDLLDVDGLLNDLSTNFSIPARDKGIVFEVKNRLPKKDSTIITDPVKLRQILLNLIGNAIKFTLNGSVKLTVALVNDTIHFEIKDTGVGIKNQDLGMIFDRFMQAENDNSLIARGTGLGLSISKGFATLLGGNISVDSKYGKGSTFLLKIPHIKPTADFPLNFESASNNMSMDTPDWSDKTILLAEDEPVNVMYMKIALKKTGANVLVAGTGGEAISLFEQNESVDVILMDIKMPEMDGFEAAEILKSKGCKAPVIALSGHAMIEQERIDKSGFAELISKPVRKDDLLNALSKYLGS